VFVARSQGGNAGNPGGCVECGAEHVWSLDAVVLEDVDTKAVLLPLFCCRGPKHVDSPPTAESTLDQRWSEEGPGCGMARGQIARVCKMGVVIKLERGTERRKFMSRNGERQKEGARCNCESRLQFLRAIAATAAFLQCL